MAAAPTKNAPRTEAGLDEALARRIKRTYGRASWTMKTHKATGGRYGLPDRIYVVHGLTFFFELKAPGQHHPVSTHQRRELRDLRRAGAIADVITDVDQAMTIIADALQQAGINPEEKTCA